MQIYLSPARTHHIATKWIIKCVLLNINACLRLTSTASVAHYLLREDYLCVSTGDCLIGHLPLNIALFYTIPGTSNKMILGLFPILIDCFILLKRKRIVHFCLSRSTTTHRLHDDCVKRLFKDELWRVRDITNLNVQRRRRIDSSTNKQTNLRKNLVLIFSLHRYLSR